MKTCICCRRRLPLDDFQRKGGGKRTSECRLCHNDKMRARVQLAPIPRDPVQVRINNAFNLWHGPVSRVPLRSAA